MSLQKLIIDVNNVNINELFESWNWLIGDMKRVLMVSKMGDLFLLGNDNGVYWLATDTGSLTKVAKDLDEFELYLTQPNLIDNWFLPGLIEELEQAGKLLQQDEVYSFLKMPVFGGTYEVENIEPTNVSVHISITGQIFERIKDLPDGTSIKISIVD